MNAKYLLVDDRGKGQHVEDVVKLSEARADHEPLRARAELATAVKRLLTFFQSLME